MKNKVNIILFALGGTVLCWLNIACNLKIIPPCDTVARFEVVQDTTCADSCEIVFINKSTLGAEYQWNFGDDKPVETTRELSTKHTFTKTGALVVTLTVIPGSECPTEIYQDTIFIKGQQVNARFSVDMTECFAPCTIKFTNQSANATTNIWDFNDGTTPSDIGASTFTRDFKTGKDYQVKLTASGPKGTDDTTITIRVKERLFVKDIPLGADNTVAVNIKFIQRNADGTYNLIANNRSIILQKTNINAEPIDSPLSDNYDGNSINISNVVPNTASGGYWAAGHVGIFNQNTGATRFDYYVSRISNSFSFIKDERFSAIQDGPYEIGLDAFAMSDGGVVLCGQSGAVDNGNDSLGMLFIKSDINMNQRWQKHLFNPDENAVAAAMLKTNNGYLIAGQKNRVANQPERCVLRLDNNFNVSGAVIYLDIAADPFEQYITDLIQLDEQTCIVISADGWVHRVNLSNSTHISKKLPARLSQALRTNDNRLAIVGDNGATPSEAVLYFLDLNTLQTVGDLHNYLPAGSTAATANTIIETPDGGFMIGGGTSLSTGIMRGLLIRTDKDGNTQ